MSDAVEISSTYRHAEALIELLVDKGPLTRQEACHHLGWPEGRFSTAIKFAREELCPVYEFTIPSPTPEDGWRYQVTNDWVHIEAGASFMLGGVETRLRSITRDVEIIFPQLDPHSKEGRRANFLRKHLTHILSTLGEISEG